MSFRSPTSTRTALALSVIATIAVCVLEFRTGSQITFPLLYLIPISAATWFGGKRIGLPLSAAAAVTSFILRVIDQQQWGVALWNMGERFGMFLAVCVLLDHLKQHDADAAVVRSLHRVLVWTVAFGILLAGVGFVAEHHLLARPTQASTVRDSVAPIIQTSATTRQSSTSINALLARLVQDVPATMQSSRPVLLGSRDPSGPSCVNISRNGAITALPTNPGDLDGGPGTKMATLYFFDRQNIKTPGEDYQWHQVRLKQFLGNTSNVNARASQFAEHLADEAARLSAQFEALSAWPRRAAADAINPVAFTERTDWPSYCLASLADAIAANDLDSSKRWSAEFAASTFALADLHRWLGFLTENHLAALEFQARCETLFASADTMLAQYDPSSTVSQFPAGVLSLNGLGNYYEVERQAERVFWMPPDRIEALKQESLTPMNADAIWAPPSLRKDFLKLQSLLSSQNHRTWAQAARTPFEHSYLVNMLFRASRGEVADDMAASLRRIDAVNPRATVGELLSPLMYRGHSFGGLEWSDRYLPMLVSAAENIKGSDTEAFLAAAQWTNNFYRAPASYGVTLTLRDAIDQKRLDCVRATDMIGAVYRNSGHIGFGHVRWCAETAGHSVAAMLRVPDNKHSALLADGLVPTTQLEPWPDAYFHGHAWPAGMERNPTPYAMELYLRGIDSYVWAEGYIVRGPNAGTLQRADIPYSTLRRTASVEKVFNGPYPQ